jgi:hypothetical protein
VEVSYPGRLNSSREYCGWLSPSFRQLAKTRVARPFEKPRNTDRLKKTVLNSNSTKRAWNRNKDEWRCQGSTFTLLILLLFQVRDPLCVV